MVLLVKKSSPVFKWLRFPCKLSLPPQLKELLCWLVQNITFNNYIKHCKLYRKCSWLGFSYCFIQASCRCQTFIWLYCCLSLFHLSAVATFWPMSLVGIYPDRVSFHAQQLRFTGNFCSKFVSNSKLVRPSQTKCFISHPPLSQERGSVIWAKKKKEWDRKKKERKTESLPN